MELEKVFEDNIYMMGDSCLKSQKHIMEGKHSMNEEKWQN